MKEKKNPVVSSLYFFGGVLLCLFSVSLILNVWYIARVFTFLPSYIFGAGSYFVYFVIYVLGMSLLFREKTLGIKKFLTITGIIFIYLAILIGLTKGYHSSAMTFDELGKYNEAFTNFGNYVTYKPEGTLGLFDAKGFNFSVISKGIVDGKIAWKMENDCIPFGGGILGYALVAVFDAIPGNFFSWVMVVILALAGLFLVFRRQIVVFIKKSFPGHKKAVRDNDEGDDFDAFNEKPNIETNMNSDPMVWSTRAPRSINNTPEQAPAPQPLRPEGFEQNQEAQQFGPMPVYGAIGSFTIARYIRPGMPAPTEAAAPAPIAQHEEPTEERHEQTFLDFDAKPEINEELVMAKPEFEEPKIIEPVVQQPVAPAPAPAVAPQVTPVIRKPLKWVPPSAEMLLTVETTEAIETNTKVAQERSVALDEAFVDFRIGAHVKDFTIGPSVTRFNIEYDSSASSKAVERIVEDLSRRLGGVSTRFESVVEGQYTSGLEVPNRLITTVSFKEVYEALPDVKKHPLAVAFGKNIQGDVIWADYNEFPHSLVAGTTGSGKSVFVNSVITTLIMRNSPDDLRLVLVDPKKVEMTKYKDMPHLLCPVVNEASQAKLVMSKLVEEMEDRYSKFEHAEGCTSIKEYNEYALEKGLPKLPYILVVLDEYADLIDSCKDLSLPVVQIGQKARACGIHMMIATQRPSTDVITGVIKSNLPTHIALMTASATDSITIVGQGGAEKLLGKGDMLVQSPLVSRVGMTRLQSCFIQRKEMIYVVGYLKEHYPLVYDERFLNLEEKSAAAGQAMVESGEVLEPLDAAEEMKYNAIKDWVMSQQYMSMSRIQREMSVGFNRAGRFFIRLQKEGIVSTENEGGRGCKVLARDDESSSIPTSDEISSIGN